MFKIVYCVTINFLLYPQFNIYTNITTCKYKIIYVYNIFFFYLWCNVIIYIGALRILNADLIFNKIY